MDLCWNSFGEIFVALVSSGVLRLEAAAAVDVDAAAAFAEVEFGASAVSELCVTRDFREAAGCCATIVSECSLVMSVDF